MSRSTVPRPDPYGLTPEEIDRLRRLRGPLLRWYGRHRRDLPWRRTNDPYSIWVAEVMLQQTRVETVLPYYRRFLERFPDVGLLADASEEQVLACWSGLGYYRRARDLRAGARRVVDDHGGYLPRDPSALRALPGVGRYTAGAIASIAFDLPEPILDGNVRRVLARVLARRRARPGGSLEEDRRLWIAAARIVKGRAPGKLNQSLMELGALVCTPARPRCTRCPASRECAAMLAGNPEAYPALRPRTRTVSLRVGVAWITRGSRVLLRRRNPRSPFRGSWDLPAIELGAEEDSARALHAALADLRLDVPLDGTAARLDHGILHRRLRMEVHPGRLRRGSVAPRADLRWSEPAALDGVAISGATRKIAAAMTR